MPMGIGLPEIILILMIALVVLGPKKLPGAGKALGHGIREFKDSVTGGSDKPQPTDQERLAA